MFEELIRERDAQLDALTALELEAGGLLVRQCDALLEIWDTTPPDSRAGRRPHVLAEAGTALGLHPQSVGRRLGMAMSLREHPLLRSLLRDGRLGVAHALVTIDEIDALGDVALADRVLAEVLASGGRLGWDGAPAELRRALRRAAVRLDPAAAARRRQEAAERDSGVRLRPLPDGLAAWVTTGPAGQLGAADQILDVLSRPAGPDDERTHGQRQVDALLAALVARAGSAADLELQLEIPVQVTDTRQVSPVCPPEPLTIQADLSPDLLALLQEPTPAPTGAAVMATEPPNSRDPLGVRRRRHEAGPEMLGHGTVDPGLLAELLTDPAGLPVGLGGVKVRRVCVDPLGQVVAVDDRAVPLARLLEGHRTKAGLLGRLTSGLPAPPPMTDAYQPTAAQARLLRARDATCCFPGCGRRSRRCELDHRRPHPDGPTSVANLHPLCKQHHRLKHDGWTCARSPDGTTTWTSPRGAVHRARPD
ncbi:MAG TPA: DUF222 domain-containing protein [Mycobacteriales bacterium]|jgi:hypothetical protein|nr:DUF222 domain-containing protein [Mycobacteriales bacterium]